MVGKGNLVVFEGSNISKNEVVTPTKLVYESRRIIIKNYIKIDAATTINQTKNDQLVIIVN